jgi:hypothetical protein
MNKLIAFLIGFIFWTITLLACGSEITGKSKNCHDIGYLSTECDDVAILPFEYVDEDVAVEKAKQHQNIEENDNKTIINIDDIIDHQEDDIIIKSHFENN